MKHIGVYAGLALLFAGCATPDQLRKTEAQSAEQGYALKALRSELDSNAAQVADLRKQISQLRGLEAAVNDAVVRADAAKIQGEGAQATSKEFLANLIATREEQRRQLDQNGTAFAELRRKNAELDSRLQAQQRVLEQRAVSFNDAVRRLSAVETGLQDAVRQSDAKTAQQLSVLSKQVAETRALINSEGLLQLMRQVEDMRRNSALLRGSIEELQKAQTDSSAQVRNFYLDLDTRIRLMKQNSPQQVKQSPAFEQPAVPAQDAASDAAAAQGRPIAQ